MIAVGDILFKMLATPKFLLWVPPRNLLSSNLAGEAPPWVFRGPGDCLRLPFWPKCYVFPTVHMRGATHALLLTNPPEAALRVAALK